MYKQIQITTQLFACQNLKKDKFGKMTALPWKTEQVVNAL